MLIYLNMDSLKTNWSHSDSTGNMRPATLSKQRRSDERDDKHSVDNLIKYSILKWSHSICKLCAELAVLRQAQLRL